jgi:Family of unknown function (DUF6165)
MSDVPRVPVSWGELIDKITILEIKAERLREPAALDNVRRELALLLDALPPPTDGLDPLRRELGEVNRRLWDIEDAIRAKEASRSFDAEFVALARSVYRTNDERARIKRDINHLLQSPLIEEKHYVQY